jgi:microcystin-dependent protein
MLYLFVFLHQTSRMSIAAAVFPIANSHTKPTVGDYKFSAVGIDHLGWLVCDGRSVNVSDFQFLFDVIGYSFGGSNDVFTLPNPAGRVPGSVGSGAGLTTRLLGDSVGEERHTLTVAELASHNHGITDPGHRHNITDPGHSHSYFNQPYTVNPATSLTTTDVADNVNVNQTTGTSVTGISVNISTTGITVNNNGSNAPHNNMQPTLFIGNVFIYSGKPNVGATPFTTGYYALPPTSIRAENVF